jgi:hypothetical protein
VVLALDGCGVPDERNHWACSPSPAAATLVPQQEAWLTALTTDDRISLLSSVDPSRWTSNYYFRIGMYDPS